MTKRIVMLTLGSRGDVQPLIALGMGLRNTGYEVTIGAQRAFEDFITSHGLDFAPIAGDPQKLMERMASDKAGATMFKITEQIEDWLDEFIEEGFRDMWNACQGADLIIFSFVALIPSVIAEKLNIPAVAAYFFPLGTPTNAYAGVNFPEIPYLPKVYNRITHHLERYGIGLQQRKRINQWRKETLGWKPYSPLNVDPYLTVNGDPVHRIYGYSSHIVPRPSDFPPYAHVTGYWFLDDAEAWEPPAPLQAFLDAGEPPVFVGFGSLIDRDSQHLIDTAVAAARQAGKRLLLLSGWAALNKQTLSDDVFVVKSAPHDWLFPRMSAIVHHGGAGTTGAALRSGVPSIIVPFFGDQPFWGRTLHRQGVSPAPIPAGKLTADQLAQAITEATESESIRQRAAEVGEAIRAEDGVGNAIQVIQQILEKQPEYVI